jgi:hypothetical protein
MVVSVVVVVVVVVVVGVVVVIVEVEVVVDVVVMVVVVVVCYGCCFCRRRRCLLIRHSTVTVSHIKPATQLSALSNLLKQSGYKCTDSFVDF